MNHRARVTWQVPPSDQITEYPISRKRGDTTSGYAFIDPVPATSLTPSYNNTQQLPDGVFFTFRVRARSVDNSLSGFSKLISTATVQAVNDAPVPLPDTYSTTRNRTLPVNTRAEGVLGNDTDVDSPPAAVFAEVVTPPTNGTLTSFNNLLGTFTYRPRSGFIGTDTFTYKAHNGQYTAEPPAVPMNAAAEVMTVTVTITVTR